MQNDELARNNEKYSKIIADLEEKNQKIQLQNDQLNQGNANYQTQMNKLKEINKNLQKKNDEITKENENYQRQIKEIKIECKYEGNEFEGIFTYLIKKYGEELIEKGIIKLSDAHIKSGKGLNDLFKNNSTEYHNQLNGITQKSDGWFEIDFGERRINLTLYSLKTTSNYSYPKSFQIVGSNDRNKWIILDHQTNARSLNGTNKQHRFECEESQQYYRYIRFVQEDSWGSLFRYNIVLERIELFGSIISSI